MIELETSGRTDPGCVRPRNEDAWIARPDLGLVAVADGMGGHPAGDVASRIALDALVEAWKSGGAPGESGSSGGSDPPGESGSPGGSDERKGAGAGDPMGEAVRKAHDRILADGREHPARRGMGTTLTVLHVDSGEGRYTVGHVGDSRAYLFRDGALDPLTRDDTPLQKEVDAGRMSREEARVHPMGHVLSQALGTTDDPDPQVVSGPTRTSDLFLLCSDGLTAVLSEERIGTLLAEGSEAPLPEVAADLVDEALDGGAPDNVTVALLRVGAV